MDAKTSTGDAFTIVALTGTGGGDSLRGKPGTERAGVSIARGQRRHLLALEGRAHANASLPGTLEPGLGDFSGGGLVPECRRYATILVPWLASRFRTSI